jgi:hypothetical protein
MRLPTPQRIALCALLASFTLASVFPACAAETKTKRETATMMTYPIGRFEIDVPKAFTLAIQTQKLRYAEITETPWPKDVPRELARKQLWEARLSEINKLRPPKGKDKALVETRELTNTGEWARSVLYYGNDASNKDGYWDILTDLGAVAVWFKLSGLIQYQDDMLNDLIEIARAYHPGDPLSRRLKGDWFYTRHGALNLTYLEQEETYARFEKHPLELKLEVETKETHTDEAPNEGLLARTAAVIASGYAAGVNIERIRSRKRTLLGMMGEEEVDLMKSKDDAKLSFAWIYSGKKDSGVFPEIEITMDSPDGQLDEKLKIWDALLSSFKPVGR